MNPRLASCPSGPPGREAGEVAIRIVREFLNALEARDVGGAQAHLAPEVRIVAPGGRELQAVADIVANSSRRYLRIGKHVERMEALGPQGGRVVVYCSGTLHGAWPDGTEFDGIRFIDRFELRDGRIVLQEVWNDTAERRMAQARR